ncbi:Dol-P-Glc:Glc(2)Man(9)GlcNAc(2)-PP-Dol alpha-1 [Phytophthora citrophthora]|uniref:Dol-P-Glc:Glc(2)Man(9)GlcNAc(2)-PP-Dol alpha-1,2-glucosyltransferase n=1 Tax=Phytophthora citrophthora TaxID=4793 RepID=A0AAD9H2R4_9STRA|nr:Dol-P-Glc:Glc(2)Man(9)GlcNAc(2)-PP-Dol alpha-1 [Phytophthora citrophthora]
MVTVVAATGSSSSRLAASNVPTLVALGLTISGLLAVVNRTVPDPYMVPKNHFTHHVVDNFQLVLTYLSARTRFFTSLRPKSTAKDASVSIQQLGPEEANVVNAVDEWDPKITTFPGLYLVSTVYAKAALIFNVGEFCSVAVLRSINVLFAVGNVILCVLLRRHISPQDPNALLHAVRVALFPPLFFFAFLFYTDGGATFFVLLMALLAERVDLLQYPPARGSFMLSALSGAVAVLFRQTNIIWVIFVAGTVVVRCAELAHAKFIYGSFKEERIVSDVSSTTHSSLRVFLNFISVVVTNFPSILLIVWPFVLIVGCFIGFLVTNGGIVVGDKSNHEVTFHGAQVLYFIAVAASGFGLSLITPTQLKRFFGSVHRNVSSLRGAAFIFFVVAVTVGVIYRFSPVHKFMLADNRHYTFYVWRKFFLKHKLAKFLPTPVYLLGGWRCWDDLGRRRSPLWKLVYALALCLVLIPSPLVE